MLMNREEEIDFLSQSAETRAEWLKKSIEKLEQAAKKEKANFALLAYGSGVYGFNQKNFGKLNDLDLLVISHRKHDLLEILKNLTRMGIKLTEDPALMSLSEKLCLAKIDFFRIKGTYMGIPTSAHVFAYESLRGGHSPLLAFNQIFGGLTEQQAENKKNQSISRTELSFDGTIHTIRYAFTGLKNDLDLIGYESTISRRILSSANDNQAKPIPTIGVQAEKILGSKLLYEPTTNDQLNMNIGSLLEKYWRTFVRSALFYRPQANDDEIINLLARSSRFSEEFRQNLREKIQSERKRLAMQQK